MSDEIKRHPYFTNCVVKFEGFDGDTAKLKPQGVRRTDVILRARAELGRGLAPTAKRRALALARDLVTNYRSRKAASR